MIPESNYPDLAENLSRYLDVLASEWRSMRNWLADKPTMPSVVGFGQSPRRFELELPDVPASTEHWANTPSVLHLDALDRDRAALSAVVSRMRFTPESLEGAAATQSVSHILSPFVPRPTPGRLVVVAPDDDEAGRMLMRAFWLKELTDHWVVDDEAVQTFRPKLAEAIRLVAADPFLAGLVRRVLASLSLINHPHQRGGLCSASATHAWISPMRCPTADEVAGVLVSAAVQNGLYLDEMLHPKWNTDPATLDATVVTAPWGRRQVPMEYDSAFHAVHVEYVRQRHPVGKARPNPDAGNILAGIAGLLEHRDHLSEHGQEMLAELRDRCSTVPVGGR